MLHLLSVRDLFWICPVSLSLWVRHTSKRSQEQEVSVLARVMSESTSCMLYGVRTSTVARKRVPNGTNTKSADSDERGTWLTGLLV